MNFRTFLVSADRQIVNAYHPDAPLGEQPCGADIEVRVVFDEDVCIPTSLGIVGAEENPFPVGDLESREILSSTDLLIPDLDNSRRTDHRINGNRVHPGRARDEMDRGVHVRSRVDSERQARYGGGIASVQVFRVHELDGGIARIMDHLVADRNRNVNPLSCACLNCERVRDAHKPLA